VFGLNQNKKKSTETLNFRGIKFFYSAKKVLPHFG